MNKFEKMVYKDSKYMERAKHYTECRKAQALLAEEVIKSFKLREICNWLENLLKRIKS